jgi:hypothetical protein
LAARRQKREKSVAPGLRKEAFLPRAKLLHEHIGAK